jgi:serine protease Do
MKKFLLQICGAMVLSLLLHNSGFTQDKENDDDLVAPGRAGRVDDEIIIRHKGNKDSKVTVEIKNGDVYINGKPANEYEDSTLSITKRKVRTFNYSRGGNLYLGPGQTMKVSPFRNGGTWNLEDGEGRAFLGVTTEDVDGGAKIKEISKNSAAEKAGLKLGDVITKVGDSKVDGPESLSEAVKKHQPEDKVTVTIKRDGKEQQVSAVLGKAPSQTYTFTMPPMNEFKQFAPRSGDSYGQGYGYSWSNGKPRLGIKAQDTEDGKGVKVLDVSDESAADKAGVKEGDVIVKFDGKEVNSATQLAELAQAAREKPSVHISLLRGGKAQELDVKFPKKLKTANL